MAKMPLGKIPHHLHTSANRPDSWLLLGVCGAGMRAMADVLSDCGQNVVGTDTDEDALATVFPGCDRQRRTVNWSALNDDFDFRSYRVIHSIAIDSAHPILKLARDAGCTIHSLPNAVSHVFQNARHLCVAGTHGKTTTSGMLWWILQHSGKAPAGFVGGEFSRSTSLPSSAHLVGPNQFGGGDLAVIESCEYRRTFLAYRPQVAVITGIEPDHFDCFTDEHDTDQAYHQFLDLLPPDGRIVLRGNCPRTRSLAKHSRCRAVTFGNSRDCDWTTRPTTANSYQLASATIPTRRMMQSFELVHADGQTIPVDLMVPGVHNMANATAAILAAQECGISITAAAECLATFPGMNRRLEYRGAWRGAELFDDYARHPTAVAAAVGTLRQLFPGRRLLAILEPHQISRTQRLFADFRSALRPVDECLILPVLAARERAAWKDCCELSGRLVRQLSESGGRAFLMANLDQVLGRLDHSVKPGDIVLTMGAGRTHRIHDELHRRFQRDSAA
jgi:UDP-N-acetylmuramate--alanine ligase